MAWTSPHSAPSGRADESHDRTGPRRCPAPQRPTPVQDPTGDREPVARHAIHPSRPPRCPGVDYRIAPVAAKSSAGRKRRTRRTRALRSAPSLRRSLCQANERSVKPSVNYRAPCVPSTSLTASQNAELDEQHLCEPRLPLLVDAVASWLLPGPATPLVGDISALSARRISAAADETQQRPASASERGNAAVVRVAVSVVFVQLRASRRGAMPRVGRDSPGSWVIPSLRRLPSSCP
jgi:hypothetical protein